MANQTEQRQELRHRPGRHDRLPAMTQVELPVLRRLCDLVHILEQVEVAEYRPEGELPPFRLGSYEPGIPCNGASQKLCGIAAQLNAVLRNAQGSWEE